MRLSPATAVVACAALVLAMPSTADADEIRDAQWHLPALDIPTAHRISTGEGVTVGIVDSGVDAQHPDLVDAVQPGIAVSGAFDPLTDANGSGTAVASVVAGRGNGSDGEGAADGNGVLGIAPAAQVVSASIGDATIGEGVYVAQAVDDLVAKGVDMILLTISHSYNEETQNSILAALEAQIPVVTSAGSSGENIYSNVVNVVATNRAGELSGAPAPEGESLFVAAPGEELPVAAPGGAYTTFNGTAVAAAIVVGTMALVKAHQPDLVGQQLIHHVLTEGTAQPNMDPPEVFGAGVIDPVAALTAGGQDVPESEEGDRQAQEAIGPADNTLPVVLITIGGLLVQAALLAYARLAKRKQMVLSPVIQWAAVLTDGL